MLLGSRHLASEVAKTECGHGEIKFLDMPFDNIGGRWILYIYHPLMPITAFAVTHTAARQALNFELSIDVDMICAPLSLMSPQPMLSYFNMRRATLGHNNTWRHAFIILRSYAIATARRRSGNNIGQSRQTRMQLSLQMLRPQLLINTDGIMQN